MVWRFKFCDVIRVLNKNMRHACAFEFDWARIVVFFCFNMFGLTVILS